MNKLIIAVIFSLAVTVFTAPSKHSPIFPSRSSEFNFKLLIACRPSGQQCSVDVDPCPWQPVLEVDNLPRRTDLYWPPAPNKNYQQQFSFPMPTAGEVMILQDIGYGVDKDDISSVSNTLQTIVNFFQQEMPDMRLAFATFNESLGSYLPRTTFSSDVSNRGYLKSAIDAVAAAYPKTIRLPDSPNNGAVLDAVIDAAKDSNIGWSNTAAKFIVVLTRFGYPAGSPFMIQANFEANLLRYGALPIFCTQVSSNPGKAQFQALVNAIKIGVVGNGK